MTAGPRPADYLTFVTGEAESWLSKAYSKAGAVASETIYQMRTVASLQAEEAMIKKYRSFLGEAQDAGEMRARKVGFANGLIFSTGNLQTGATLLCKHGILAPSLPRPLSRGAGVLRR